MHFPTVTVSTMVLALTIATTTLIPSQASAAKSDCDRCVEDAMLKLQPACANLGYIGDISQFSDDKLTPQHRKCFCSVPAGNSWYQPCYISEKCNNAQMELMNMIVTTFKNKTICPAPSASTADAAANVGAGNGSPKVIVSFGILTSVVFGVATLLGTHL